MSSVMERLCCLGWWSASRKHKATPGAESDDDDDDDVLIEAIDLPVRRSWFRALPDRRRVHQTPSDAETGIAVLSHGRIKYVKDGSLPPHVAVPIIDPLIGRNEDEARKEAAGHQRQLFPQLFPRRLPARRGIFHFHNRGQHREQQWWDSSTPPSSVDLEWEHEGLMPPEEEAGADNNDGSECQSDDDEAAIGAASPASACHSLEWDGDDFLAHGHQQASDAVSRPQGSP